MTHRMVRMVLRFRLSFVKEYIILHASNDASNSSIAGCHLSILHLFYSATLKDMSEVLYHPLSSHIFQKELSVDPCNLLRPGDRASKGTMEMHEVLERGNSLDVVSCDPSCNKHPSTAGRVQKNPCVLAG